MVFAFCTMVAVKQTPETQSSFHKVLESSNMTFNTSFRSGLRSCSQWKVGTHMEDFCSQFSQSQRYKNSQGRMVKVTDGKDSIPFM